MLLVKTKIGSSKIHGTGLFAAQFIPKGTVTFKYTESFDVGFTSEQLDQFPELTQKYLHFYCYFDKVRNKFILCSDDQKFINHSKNTNILSTPDVDIAERDIEEGEELLCDYYKFDDNYFERHGIKEEHLKN